MTTDDRFLVIVAGPTAVGKTSTAIHIASHFSAEIISADSRQFFREMKIGTAFPSAEELARVPHHFAGHLSIHDSYNVSRFETDVLSQLDHCFARQQVCVLTGGSGLYINAIVDGIDVLPDPDESLRQELKFMYAEKGIVALQDRLLVLDPVYHARVDLQNPVRLIRALEVCIATGKPYSSLRAKKSVARPFRVIPIGLTLAKEELNARINDRVDRMVAAGLVEEARSLYPFRHLNALNTVGYKELFDHFDGRMSLGEAVEKIKTNTRRYAKRQMTWFRKDQRYKWFAPDDLTSILAWIGTETGIHE
jgi:tRNA dimethylallyltransferase